MISSRLNNSMSGGMMTTDDRRQLITYGRLSSVVHRQCMSSAFTTLDRLRLDSQFTPNVVAWEKIPLRPARYADFPTALDSRLVEAARRRGISALYTHQSDAVAAALHGENVVVVTGTASGKTLCYNLPVLHTLLNNPEARALYLFPTKALAQDQ